MKDLNKFIQESILSDYDTIAARGDKVFDRPFLTLWRTVDNGCDWDTAVQTFQDTISPEGKWVNSCPIELAKNEVFVGYYYEQQNKDIVKLYVRFNKTKFQQLAKALKLEDSLKEPAIAITVTKFNGRLAPTTEFTPKLGPDKINGGYILSNRHAQDALRMIQLMSKFKWPEKN